jgi:hypothetical protein
MLCALSFNKRRLVIFSHDGQRLLAVVGDGPSLIIVS